MPEDPHCELVEVGLLLNGVNGEHVANYNFGGGVDRVEYNGSGRLEE